MNRRYENGAIILGNWTLVRLIGEGSFGRVYEAIREDFGVKYSAAIKIITIPQNESEIKNARMEGMDEASVTSYFRSFVEEIVQEFALMSRLKGTANIVSYEDHSVVEHVDRIGWDIIIRMELLTPLLDYAFTHTMTRKDVIQLGIDICRALELCQKYNIVHRDIKPENIFVSELGDFKLGDFGIARTVEKTTGGMSKKGTYTYMAPEIYRDEAYGSSVDIYSLGIVMYRLLNANRAPFMPEYPAPITHSDRETALTKRISGAKFPSPKNADGRLAEIVLKACAYAPEDRFSSPMQMREELEAIQYNRVEAHLIYPGGDEAPIKSLEYVDTYEDAPVTEGLTPREELTESVLGLPRKDQVDLDNQTVSVFASMPENADEKMVSISETLVGYIEERTESTLPSLAADDSENAKFLQDPAPEDLGEEDVLEQAPVKGRRWAVPVFLATIVLVFVALSAFKAWPHSREIFNENGNLLKQTQYGLFGSVLSWSEYEYNEDGSYAEKFYDADGHINKSHYYDIDGTYAEISYNTNGQEIKSIVYLADGSISHWIDRSYDNDGEILKDTFYDTDGSVYFSIDY
ncbi:MAG: serine/threonine protein kinase [Clostridiales bacterium]|nr:serine/threonine protein kinase [Clostridiales bacterium]